MQQPTYISNTDCHYFVNATCTKGNSCPYRHSERAKASSATCTSWSAGRDCQVECPYRHPDRRFQMGYPGAGQPRSSIPCHYFKLGNCVKGAACEFSHDQPAVTPVASTLHAQAALQKQQEAAGGGGVKKTKPTAPVSQQVNQASVEILKKHSVTQRAQAATSSGTAASAKDPSQRAQSTFPKNLISRPPAPQVTPPTIVPDVPSWQVASPTIAVSAPATTSNRPPVKNANVPNHAPARPATAPTPTIPKSNKSTKKTDKTDFKVLSFEELMARKKGSNASSPPPATKTNGAPAPIPSKPSVAPLKRVAPGSNVNGINTTPAVKQPQATPPPVATNAGTGPSPAKKIKTHQTPPAPAPAPLQVRAPAPAPKVNPITATSAPAVKVVPAAPAKKPVPKKPAYDDDDDDDDEDDDGAMAEYFALLEK